MGGTFDGRMGSLGQATPGSRTLGGWGLLAGFVTICANPPTPPDLPPTCTPNPGTSEAATYILLGGAPCVWTRSPECAQKKPHEQCRTRGNPEL